MPQTPMKNIKDLTQLFNEGINNFNGKNRYHQLKSIINQISDEIQSLFGISEERYIERIKRRSDLNKKIKEHNAINEQKKDIITSDHYWEVREELEKIATEKLTKLNQTLQETNINFKKRTNLLTNTTSFEINNTFQEIEKPLSLKIAQNQEKKRQNIIHIYSRISNLEKETITNKGCYEELCRKYNMPNKNVVIYALGGDTSCTQIGYVKALLDGKGDEYLGLWKREQNKYKIRTRDDFIIFYSQLNEQEKQQIMRSSKRYSLLAKKYSELPQDYQTVIHILGGRISYKVGSGIDHNNKFIDPLCTEGGYVNALIESPESGEKYYQNRLNSKLTPSQKREKFLEFYHTLNPSDQKIVTSSTTLYAKFAKQYPILVGMQCYDPVITILGGNNECTRGAYLKALIESPEAGEKYYQNRLRNKSKQIESRDDFLVFYKNLAEKEQNLIISSDKYRSFAQGYSELPNTYTGLITLLGGHAKNHREIACLSGGYVKALIESSEAGEIYYQNRLKSPQAIKDDFLNVYKLFFIENKHIITPENWKDILLQHPYFPRNYLGIIKLFGGNIETFKSLSDNDRDGLYLEALIQGKEKEYLYKLKENDESALSIQITNFLQFYSNAPLEEQTTITSNSKLYEKWAKVHPQFPQRYGGIIKLLGGNPKCSTGGYLKALIDGKGRLYYQEWDKSAKAIITTKDGIMEFYKTLNSEEQELFFHGRSYQDILAKKYPQLKSSYRALIKLLGGHPECWNGNYVKCLIEGGHEDFYKNRLKSPEERKTEFIQIYTKLITENKDYHLTPENYTNLIVEFPEFPEYYSGLIVLLGGNKQHLRGPFRGDQDGEYLKALINGNGDQYYKNWLLKKHK